MQFPVRPAATCPGAASSRRLLRLGFSRRLRCPRPPGYARPWRSRPGQEIESNPGDDLTIEALTNEACLSPFHFARAFEAATGEAPHRCLTNRRLEKATFRISEEQLLLALIASRCELSFQTSFTKWFKRLVGTTRANTGPAASRSLPRRKYAGAWI